MKKITCGKKRCLLALVAIVAAGAVSTGMARLERSPSWKGGPQAGEGLSSNTGNAVLYNYPEEAAPSEEYAVRIDGTPYFVFPVPQTNQRKVGFQQPFFPHIVSFDIKGKVRIDITPEKTAVTSVKIRPESAGVAHTVKGNTITITLDKPQYLTVELNGHIEKPLLVFANEPETEIPDPDDPNVLFYEAGKIHNIGYGVHRPVLTSNTTVYIAPGAICYGAFTSQENHRAKNIRIMGRGILSGAKSLTANGGKWPVLLVRTANATIEGITLVDCKNWSLPLQNCENITVKGVKIVSNTGFEDGIDIVGSKDVTIDNCFIRTKDDCIALKSGVYYMTPDFTPSSVENVTVKNCVIWNGKHGNGLEIGFELNTAAVKNVTFENIDLIHAENPGQMDEGAITIHNSGTAVVRNVLYKNIRIEDPQRILFQFSVLKSDYTSHARYGKIQDIRLEDISVTSSRGPLLSIFTGLSARENVSGITFKNLVINGKKITAWSGRPDDDFYAITNKYASNITFE